MLTEVWMQARATLQEISLFGVPSSPRRAGLGLPPRGPQAGQGLPYYEVGTTALLISRSRLAEQTDSWAGKPTRG